MHVRMLLPEDLYNQLPGFSELVIWEETPSPLLVGFPMDKLNNINRQQCVVVALGYYIILLLPATGGPTLPGSPFRLGIPHQVPV